MVSGFFMDFGSILHHWYLKPKFILPAERALLRTDRL
jgi:hypothetical protein